MARDERGRWQTGGGTDAGWADVTGFLLALHSSMVHGTIIASCRLWLNSLHHRSFANVCLDTFCGLSYRVCQGIPGIQLVVVLTYVVQGITVKLDM